MIIVGAFVVDIAGAKPNTSNGLTVRSCRGRRTGHRHMRILQEPGTSCRSHAHDPDGSYRTTNSRPTGCAFAARRSETQTHDVVSPREGNRVRREKRQEIGAPHSTAESGERVPPGPWGGKGVPGHGTAGGQHGGCSVTQSRVNVTAADSGASGHSVFSRVGEPMT